MRRIKLVAFLISVIMVTAVFMTSITAYASESLSLEDMFSGLQEIAESISDGMDDISIDGKESLVEAWNSLQDALKSYKEETAIQDDVQEASAMADFFDDDVLDEMSAMITDEMDGEGICEVTLQDGNLVYVYTYNFVIDSDELRDTMTDVAEMSFENSKDSLESVMSILRMFIASDSAYSNDNPSIVWVYRDHDGNEFYRNEMKVRNDVQSVDSFTSDDWKDLEVSVEGTVIQLPISFVDFSEKTGFWFEDEQDAELTLKPNSYIGSWMVNDNDVRVYAEIINDTDDVVTLLDGNVMLLSTYGELPYESKSVYAQLVLCNGTNNRSTISEVRDIFKDKPNEETEHASGDGYVLYYCGDSLFDGSVKFEYNADGTVKVLVISAR